MGSSVMLLRSQRSLLPTQSQGKDSMDQKSAEDKDSEPVNNEEQMFARKSSDHEDSNSDNDEEQMFARKSSDHEDSNSDNDEQMVAGKSSDHEDSEVPNNDDENESDSSNILVQDKGKRLLPRRRARVPHATDESDDSEDESERAKRKRALRAFKEAKSSTKKEGRIKGRAQDDLTDESDDEKEIEKASNKSKRALEFITEEPEGGNSSDDSGPTFPRKRKMKAKPNGIISDSEEDSDEQDEENDEDDSNMNETQEDNDNDEWADMLENLKRRGTKFDELNSQYEESRESRQLGGYDLSDDEERENKYPPRLLDDLRGAVEAASLDDNVEVPPELKEDNNKLIQRWEMYNVGESTDKDGECVCGQTGLRWLFFMRLKGFESWPFHTRIVGSECIRWFCRGNPRSAMVAFARFLKEGSVATYQHQLDTKCLRFTLGGNILPPFFRDNREYHKTEYKLPIEIHDDGAIDIIVKPGTSGRVKDEAGKVLAKGYKYQVWLRPVVRPNKNTRQLPILDFVLVKVQNMKDMKEVGSKEKTGKDFLK